MSTYVGRLLQPVDLAINHTGMDVVMFPVDPPPAHAADG